MSHKIFDSGAGWTIPEVWALANSDCRVCLGAGFVPRDSPGWELPWAMAYPRIDDHRRVCFCALRAFTRLYPNRVHLQELVTARFCRRDAGVWLEYSGGVPWHRSRWGLDKGYFYNRAYIIEARLASIIRAELPHYGVVGVLQVRAGSADGNVGPAPGGAVMR